MKKAESAGYCVWYFPVTKEKKLYKTQERDFYEKPHVLLVEQHGETWSIPKGHAEKGETPIQTAVRELEEETCLILPPSFSATGYSTKSKRMSMGGKKEKKIIHMFGQIIVTSHEELSICTSDKAITRYGWFTFKNAKKVLHKSDFKAMQRLYNKYMWKQFHSIFVESGRKKNN